MWNVNFQKIGQNTFIRKKLSLFKEVAVFSIISFIFFSFCEMLLFSGIRGLEPVVWAL